MFFKRPEPTKEELSYTQGLTALMQAMQQVGTDPSLSIDDRMKALQWIYGGIPELNRLLIRIKTRGVSNESKR